jgi:RNA polymerase sigma-70 factor (ECF subfamily)
VEDIDGSYAETLTTQPEQTSHLDFQDFLTALEKLPVDQCEALILVGASGYSYGEAAKICDCAADTIRSRVCRARMRLARFLSIERPRDFGIGRDQCLQERSKKRSKGRRHSNLAKDPAEKNRQ